MRLVQLTIPAGMRESVLDVLDDEGIDYVVTDETSGREYTAVVYFPLPTNAVEPVLDQLEDIGIEEQAYTVVVDAETVVSRKFGELQERYATEDVEQERISRQELQTEAQELTPPLDIFVTMTLISSIVATAGLLLDSPAVVVGSMVIAPLIGPALGASVGTVINDRELFVEAIEYQAIGVVIAIFGGALFAGAVNALGIVPPGVDLTTVNEINERLAPDLLSLAVALGAGVAGILSIATGISVALVGVMIAAALIPPAAAAGIAIAWGWPMAALGAAVLVFVNVLCVNFAGLLTLWHAGYRPESLFELSDANRRYVRNVVVFGVAILVLSLFLGGVTYTSYQTTVFENEVNREVRAVLDSPEYEDLRLLETEVRLNDDLPFQEPERVVVTVGQHATDAEGYPDLADDLRAQIAEDSRYDVTIEVRYIRIDER